jgi:hypothetical protein
MRNPVFSISSGFPLPGDDMISAFFNITTPSLRREGQGEGEKGTGIFPLTSILSRRGEED